jgi:hypothetical protein
VPIIGDLGFGEPCTRDYENDDCQKGLFCFRVPTGSAGPGTCLEFCDHDSGCNHGGECAFWEAGLLKLCMQDCDPLAQDCDPGEGCYLLPEYDAFTCARTDHPPGAGTDGDACAAIQACEPGLICFDGDVQNGCTADRCCTPVCQVGNDGLCIDLQESCIPMYDEGYAPPGLEDVGYCGVG